MGTVTGMRWSAVELADRLGAQRPTDQQRAVIEFAEPTPALVVAGAGSGKTETMARRVVWLVANELVQPERVLGLTFTRKAAAELQKRIDDALRRLASSGVVDVGDLAFARPMVSTYNAFANRVFQDNALLAGREPDSTLLTDAAAWSLCYEVVRAADDCEDELVAIDKSPATVVGHVLELSRALADNLVDPAAVEQFAERIVVDTDRLNSERRRGGASSTPEQRRIADIAQGLRTLLPLAARYGRLKRERGLIEYSDQVALALQATEHEDVAGTYRAQFGAVFLDEYQDTSVVQTRLLARLFAGQRIMAVGDPNQAIYGWRGASAANLAGFLKDFQGVEANRFDLSTSWRNATRVLDAANVVAAPLRSESSLLVPELVPRDGAPTGHVECAVAADTADEAARAAEWCERRLADGKDTTVAILFRQRARMRLFSAALERRGVEHVLVGLGSVLESPEVVDVISALAVAHSADAGNELIRLLAGPRWRIGPGDIAGLADFARAVSSYEADKRGLSDEARSRLSALVTADERASIVDAVDLLRDPSPVARRLAERCGIGAEGLRRLGEAGDLFARLRGLARLPLPELVAATVQELGIDIELLSNETVARPRENVTVFAAKAREYEDLAQPATLGGFLTWIRRVASDERLETNTPQPERGVVQLLTVHAAKGLEWDSVLVPDLMDRDFPADVRRDSFGWLRLGQLPYPFRGDRDDLPSISLRGLGSTEELKRALTDFQERVKARALLEERRVAYVALTRARRNLMLTAAVRAPGRKTPYAPSPFLRELVDADVIDDYGDVFERIAEQPVTDPMPEAVPWPTDPLKGRRAVVERSAALVRQAMEEARHGGELVGVHDDAWATAARVLLAERDDRARSSSSLRLPTAVAASHFKDFVMDPQGTASRMYRPVPQEPFTATRLGTLFHSWVEQRYGGRGLGETIDADEVALDEDTPAAVVETPHDLERLRDLQRTFERSPWANAAPLLVEREIRVPLGTGVDEVQVVCKLDAVFQTRQGVQIVDWKTGRAPSTDEEVEQRQFQVALYRAAYAKRFDVSPESIDVVLYYVAEDRVLRPSAVMDEEQLAARWADAVRTRDRP